MRWLCQWTGTGHQSHEHPWRQLSAEDCCETEPSSRWDISCISSEHTVAGQVADMQRHRHAKSLTQKVNSPMSQLTITKVTSPTTMSACRQRSQIATFLTAEVCVTHSASKPSLSVQRVAFNVEDLTSWRADFSCRWLGMLVRRPRSKQTRGKDFSSSLHTASFTTLLYCSNTHIHTHPFNSPLSGTTWVSQYQKGKINLDFNEARDSEWQWHQLGNMQVCNSLETDNHTNTPPLSTVAKETIYAAHFSDRQ